MATAYVNGTIYTMKAEGEQCEAFVVDNGKFLYCGKEKDALRLVKENEIVDLQGAVVLPGLIDTHQHVFSYARDLTKLDLKKATSLQELKDMIREKAGTTPKHQWILGTGFNQENFEVPVLPTIGDLDAVCPDNPLIITRYCLHVNIANSAALKIGGIRRGFIPSTPGTVEFNAAGDPTGILWDQAATDIIALIPDPLTSPEAKKNAVEAALKELNKFGLTGVHPIQGRHCDLYEYTDVYQALNEEGRLSARVYLGFDELPGCSIRTGLGNEFVKFGFYKLYLDGSMGARSAALSSPYEDDPSQSGILGYTQEELDSKIKVAYDRNIQIGVHVIGDRAVDMLLNSIEKIYYENPKPNVRFRMIHMSILSEEIIGRLKVLPVIIDIQPMFVTTNVRWAESRIGHKRAQYLYCFKKLLNEGIILSAGSDSPIETYDPMKGIYAMTTRMGLDGFPEGGWFPDERVTIYEAVSMYTRNAAYASYEEDIKGTIESGKLADFILLDEDLFRLNPKDIKDIKVRRTYLAGIEVYTRE